VRASRALILICVLLSAPLAAQQAADGTASAAGDALAADREARTLQSEAEEAEAAAAAAAARMGTLAGDIQRFERDIAAAESRAETLRSERAALLESIAERQEGLTALLAALQRMSRRPALAALLAPNSAIETARTAALVETIRPEILARTESLRSDLARVETLAAQARQQQVDLRQSEADLSTAISDLETTRETYLADARTLSVEAASASARARALAEQALASETAAETELPDDVARERRLRSFRPPASEVRALGYRLPVAGEVAAGFGRANSVGVIERGVTFAARPQALVTAPAGGTVAYAGAFRGYGEVVIIDHGRALTSILSGLGSTSVSEGEAVETGFPLGQVAEDGRLQVELRRNGRPVDPLLYAPR
jgi:septal ring factor EnvC (AmiA/AmiB activator)